MVFLVLAKWYLLLLIFSITEKSIVIIILCYRLIMDSIKGKYTLQYVLVQFGSDVENIKDEISIVE